jgi:hypothetical protein
MLGGARVVARSGAWDLAGLDVQTDERDTIPSENLGVMRIRRRVLNPFSYAGTMLTSRFAGGGRYHVGTGLDAYLKLMDNEYLTVRGAATFDDSGGSPGLLGRSQLYAQWQRRSTRGLTYFAQFHRVGADYRPELGFLPRQDFTRLALFSEYYIHPARSTVRTHGPGAIGYAFLRNGDHSLETSYLAFWWPGISSWAACTNSTASVSPTGAPGSTCIWPASGSGPRPMPASPRWPWFSSIRWRTG